MMKIMFDPEGRIGPTQFREAAFILIGIGAIFGLLPFVEPSLMWWGMVSIVLIYPWIVIWIKRFHDAGKSGWMFLGVFVLWFAVHLGAGLLVKNIFAPDQGPPPTTFSAAMAQAAESAGTLALPSTVVAVVISLVFVFAANALLKSDPEPNAYDPPAHMR